MTTSRVAVDLLVIGGGINGAAVARDAAGRGLRVMLAERGDYACATSSASSKLIHGGLRYLEQREFGLVRESMAERAHLVRAAPHLVEPLRFLVPIYAEGPRPAWLVRAGLLLYDALALGKGIGRSGRLSRAEMSALPRLRQKGLRAVLHYRDAQVDDARLVLAILLDARARGADVMNRRAVTAVDRIENGYRAILEERGMRREVEARFVVNAGGPWADLIDAMAGASAPPPLRLVRGSHIALAMPQPAQRDGVTLQSRDGRVVFVLPWLEGRFLVVGTTDAPHRGEPEAARCTDEERDYLLGVYNAHFAHPGGPARPEHVMHDWSGVRALKDDGAADPSAVTRAAEVIARQNGAGGWVTLHGGKLTTHRALAEETLAALRKLGASCGGPWTAGATLHGGSLDRPALLLLARSGPASLPLATRRRWALTYGDRIADLFEHVSRDGEAAREVADGVPEAELRHAVEAEDSLTAEDFLMRRTKLGLLLDERSRQAIAQWFGNSKSDVSRLDRGIQSERR